jgi:hypothetical protein
MRLRAAGTLVLAVAFAAVAEPAEALNVKPSAEMRLDGSNGYRILIDGGGGGVAQSFKARRLGVPSWSLPKTGKTSVDIAVAGRNAATLYTTSGTTTARRVRARFGHFGRVSVTFQRARTRRLPAPPGCTGFMIRRIGVFKGTIRFRGESGYTQANTTRAPGKVDLVRHLHCGRLVAKQPRHGTRLKAESGATDLDVYAFDRRPRPLCLAFSADATRRVFIFRLAIVKPGPGAFTFAPDLSSAHLDLPPPFARAANFASPHSLTGSLTVSFPGAPDTPLAGPEARANLKRF